MGRTIADWIDHVRTVTGRPPTSDLTDEDIELYVYAAIRRFSIDSPQVAYTDYAGNGVSRTLTLPGGWQPGFSSVVGVEYPQGANPVTVLDEAEFALYPATTSPTTLLLANTTPETGQTARLYYTASWPMPTSNASVDLISDVAFEPVCQLAAHAAFLQLAAANSGNTANIGGNDFSMPTTEAMEWAARATAALKEYTAFIAGGGDSGPASGWVDWDATSTFVPTGGRFLFHEIRGYPGN